MMTRDSGLLFWATLYIYIHTPLFRNIGSTIASYKTRTNQKEHHKNICRPTQNTIIPNNMLLVTAHSANSSKRRLSTDDGSKFVIVLYFLCFFVCVFLNHNLAHV